MGFFSSLFGGSNPTLSSAIGTTGQTAGFSTGLGEKNIGQSSKFFSDILSGNPTKQAKALAPEISAIQGQTQQQLKSMAQFHNRSGGTNAAAQTAGDTARATFNNMVAKLLGTSAANLSSTGTNLLNTGLSATGLQSDLSQQQMKNWQQSLFGGALTGAVGIGLGAAGKAAGVGGLFGL